jgi:hypothetical protein
MSASIRIDRWDGTLPRPIGAAPFQRARFGVTARTMRRGAPPFTGGWTVVLLEDGTRLEGQAVLLNAERRAPTSPAGPLPHEWDLHLAWCHRRPVVTSRRAPPTRT